MKKIFTVAFIVCTSVSYSQTVELSGLFTKNYNSFEASAGYYLKGTTALGINAGVLAIPEYPLAIPVTVRVIAGTNNIFANLQAGYLYFTKEKDKTIYQIDNTGGLYIKIGALIQFTKLPSFYFDANLVSYQINKASQTGGSLSVGYRFK